MIVGSLKAAFLCCEILDLASASPIFSSFLCNPLLSSSVTLPASAISSRLLPFPFWASHVAVYCVSVL